MSEKKIKITITYTLEYTPYPELYQDCNTIDEMAEVDRINYENECGEMICDNRTNVKVTAEVIEEE